MCRASGAGRCGPCFPALVDERAGQAPPLQRRRENWRTEGDIPDCLRSQGRKMSLVFMGGRQFSALAADSFAASFAAVSLAAASFAAALV